MSASSTCHFVLINRTDLTFKPPEVDLHSDSTKWMQQKEPIRRSNSLDETFWCSISGHEFGHAKARLRFGNGDQDFFNIDFSWGAILESDRFVLNQHFESKRYYVTLRYFKRLNGSSKPPFPSGISGYEGDAHYPMLNEIGSIGKLQDLGIAIYVDECVGQNTLKVMTYNTHLFKYSIGGELWNSLGHKIIVEDDQRRAAIVRKIFEVNPDVVCLQEVWSETFQLLMLDDLSARYPFIYIPPDDRTLISIDKLVSAANYILGKAIDQKSIMPLISSLVGLKLGNTSGLFIASRLPLSEIDFKTYTNVSDPVDQLSKKGFVSFTAHLFTKENAELQIRMGTTHTPTIPDEALIGIEDAAKNVVIAKPWIILGDFNLHLYGNPDSCKLGDTEYAKLESMFARLDGQAQDVVAMYCGDIEKCYTDWQAGNSLSAEIEWNNDTKARIDYVYFSCNTEGSPRLVPKRVDIPRDWQIGGPRSLNGRNYSGLDLSDHWPIIVEFGIE